MESLYARIVFIEKMLFDTRSQVTGLRVDVDNIMAHGVAAMSVLPDRASFPANGDTTTIYVDSDTSQIYRYDLIDRPGYDWTVGVGGDFATLPLALASPLVVDGDRIRVLDGDYLLSSTLVVSKRVIIFGESRAGTVLHSAGGAGDPTILLSITADGVIIRDLTISHRTTANTSVEAAITVSRPGFPATRVRDVTIQNCSIEYMKHGIVLRGEAFRVEENTIAYIGPSGRTRRAIIIYAATGNSFITGNTIANNLATGNLRAIYISTGATVEDVTTGILSIEDNVGSGTMSHFVLQDGYGGTSDGFSLFVKRNVVVETAAFVVFYFVGANNGNIFHQVVAESNTLTNVHEGGPGGKGIFGVDDGGTGLAFRSIGPLSAHIASNHPSTTLVLAGYVLASGAIPSTAASCCTTTMPLVVITQDAVIPSTPLPVVGTYYELSP